MFRFSVLARSALGLAIGFVDTTARADDARKGIDACNAALRAAVLADDAQKVAALYSPNAEIIPPGAPIAAGSVAIAAFWKGFVDSSPKDLVLETDGVASSGDPEVEDGAVSASRYVSVWKKESDTWNTEK